MDNTQDLKINETTSNSISSKRNSTFEIFDENRYLMKEFLNEDSNDYSLDSISHPKMHVSQKQVKFSNIIFQDNSQSLRPKSMNDELHEKSIKNQKNQEIKNCDPTYLKNMILKLNSKLEEMIRKNKSQENEINRLNHILKDSESLNKKLMKEISSKTKEIEKIFNERKNQANELILKSKSENKIDSGIKKFVSNAKIEILREFEELKKKWKNQFNSEDYEVIISVIDKNPNSKIPCKIENQDEIKISSFEKNDHISNISEDNTYQNISTNQWFA